MKIFQELLPNHLEDACNIARTRTDGSRYQPLSRARIKENHPDLNLVEIEGFGGRIKVLGKTSVDLRNPDKVKKWAERLGEKFNVNIQAPVR